MNATLRRRLPGALEAGLGPGGMGTLYRLGLISAGKALTLVVLAQCITTGIVSVINGTGAWHGAVTVGLLAAVARAALSWGGQVAAARSALGAKEKLRGQLAERLLAGGTAPVGSSTVLATRGLDQLDEYYGSVLPAVMNAVVIPLVIGVRILTADWFSAAIIVVTVPLIPVFMALVGMHSRERVADSSRALARMSDHLVELARGLPVLVGLGRIDEQTAALETLSSEYRTTTMFTLRTAFLSSLVLELLSTISVAIVAVFVGLRLLNGSLPLEVGLLALILAPECYAPFRDLGAAFHASQNGLNALRSAQSVIRAVLPSPILKAGGKEIEVRNLTVTYADRTEPAIAGFNARFERNAITSLNGVSGSGKSTVLGVLVGRLCDGTDGAHISGAVTGIDRDSVAWLPQHPTYASETVLEELHLFGDGIPHELLENRIAELCRRLGLVHALHDDPSQLSPGELRRLALLRALLRVEAGAWILVLDEPTAHLDEANAAAVRRELERLRGSVTIVLASHDPIVNALASRHVEVGRQSQILTSPAARPAAFQGHDISAGTDATRVPVKPSVGVSIRLLDEFVGESRGRFIAASALAIAASLFAVSLTALSGWLIVRASEHPAIMYLLVAIVGVRFFGIGRSVLHYGERLATHDAIFRSTDALRMRLWRAIASLGASSRRLLRGGTTIDYLVITTDRVRDLFPRVVIPLITGASTAVVAVAATVLLHAPAAPLIGASMILCLVVAPLAASAADRQATQKHSEIASGVGRRFASVVAAATDLRVNGVGRAALSDLSNLDSAAAAMARRSVWSAGAGQSIVVAVCCSTAILMLPVCLPAVHDGTLPAGVMAVLVLLPLALMEPLLGLVSAVQLWPTLTAALSRTQELTEAALHSEEREGTGVLGGPVDELALDNVAGRWPAAPQRVFEGVTATVNRGDWLVLRGPSGAGKSTLLTLLLGYLQPAVGRYSLARMNTLSLAHADLRRHISWAPQEGHLFDSTIRANLLIARARAEAPADEELIAILHRVGLGDLLASLPLGLDTRVGSQGSHLSGGQRQRLAVARTLLTGADVVLLDEPTAHLDEESAAALMADLRAATQEQIVVLVTHSDSDIRASDHVVDLSRNRVTVPE